MALFNNVSLVLLLLLVVSSIADASRFLEVSSESEATGEPKFCSRCECKEENGNIRCYRTDRKIGGCPLVCSASCGCDKMMPPTCWCTYEVDTCSPSECPVNTVTVLENLLAYNIGN